MKAKTDDYTAGDFRQPVIIQRVTYTPDDSGGQTKVWSNYKTIWCYVANKASTEKYADSALGRVRSVDLWEFCTWFFDDIRMEDRLVWDGRNWNIRDIENVMGRNKFLRMTAEAGVEQ